MIIVISFIKIGTPDVIPETNAFLCLIICLFSFWLQIKYEPFITSDLNNLNFNSTLLMNITIFFGLFISIAQDDNLQIFLLAILFFLNILFILAFCKSYILLKVVSIEHSKILLNFKEFLKKFWLNGNIIKFIF